MKLPPIKPLSKWGRVSRSTLIVTLLLGNLFPVPGNVVLIAMILTTLVLVYELFRWLPKIHPMLAVIVFFLILASHSLATTVTSAYGADKLTKWVTITLVSALAASLLRDRRTIQTLGWAWLIAALGLAVLTLAGYDGGRATLDGSANPIWLARAMATGIVFAAWMWSTKTARPIPMIVAIALLTGGMIASGSRGPALGVVVGLVVLAVFGGRGRAWRTVAIVLGGAAAFWAVQNLPIFADSRFATLFQSVANDQTRTRYWNLTGQIIAAHPEGVGFGNWAAAAGWPRHLWPHNLFLEVFAELGVPIGVLVLAVVVLVVARLVWRALKDPVVLCVLALLAVELVAVLVSGDLNARTFWFLLALGFLVTTRSVLDVPLHPVQKASRLAKRGGAVGSDQREGARLSTRSLRSRAA